MAIIMTDIKKRGEAGGIGGMTVEGRGEGKSTVDRASFGWRKATVGRRTGASFLTHREDDNGRRGRREGEEGGTRPPPRKSSSHRNQDIFIILYILILLTPNKLLKISQLVQCSCDD